MFLEVKSVNKSYGNKENKVKVLNDVNVSIDKGTICVILGPSGSGKSTFLNVIGGLETVDSGEILIDGKDIAKLDSKKLSLYRRDSLGFIFQFYNLVPNLTVQENIEVCEYLTNKPIDKNDLIKTLGLWEHRNKFPRQLSGGQQQRTAIARALIKNPKILLCDEPTGALDSKTSKEILQLLEEVNKKYNMTMFIVTHNNAIKNMAHQIIKIRDGRISENYQNKKILSASEIRW